MICRQSKCIYIHIPKSAGQSIHQVFTRRLGYYRKTKKPLLLGSNHDPRQGPPAFDHLKAADYVPCGHISQDESDHYTHYYDDETREFVAELLKKDIDAFFGYTFKGAASVIYEQTTPLTISSYDRRDRP